MRLLQLVLFVLIYRPTFTNSNSSACKTPGSNSENGLCVIVTKCPELFKLLKEGNSTEKAFVQASVCGAKHFMPAVCCKLSNYTRLSAAALKASENVTVEYFNTTNIPDRTTCGPVRGIDKILEGNETEIGQFPWTAALAYKSTEKHKYEGVRCGGSLITAKYVLTAAHCIRDYEPESIRVLLGEWKLSTDPDCTSDNQCAPNVLSVEIEKLISHHLYSRLGKINDIALIRLKCSVHFNDFIRPICLPPNGLPSFTNRELLIATGWGRKVDGLQSDIAFKTPVTLLSNENCLKLISRSKGILPTEFCVTKKNNKVCNGDSGGPLMRLYQDAHHCNWILEGVLGSGIDCHTGVSALIYTRVSTFTSWILNTIAAYGLCNQ